MNARKDYMAPLRMWQESRLHAGPYQVPEYEDFARMVKAMEDMNARIKELEAAADYTDGIWRFWNKTAREQTSKYLAEHARAEALRKENERVWNEAIEAAASLLTGQDAENVMSLARIAAQEGKE